MLLYSEKMDRYVKYKLFPKILLDPKKYFIKGSFRRKIPFVTDIDVVNQVYPEINDKNIYQEICNLIESLKTEPNIVLLYVSCGVDERFRIKDGDDAELDKLKMLLDDKDAKEFEDIVEKYEGDSGRKIFFVTEIIWKYYKIHWSPDEVLENKKKLVGDVNVKFTDMVDLNNSLLLKYYVKIETYPIGIDVVVNYKPFNPLEAYKNAADYQLRLANYSKEYYYMLFPFRYYFKDDKLLSRELENLIERKFGLYKQLMTRIDTYHTLYDYNNLDIKTASAIVTSIVKDTTRLPDFQSKVVDEITEVSRNNDPKSKMEKWYVLLVYLYNDINKAVNDKAEEYFYHYLDKIPEDKKKEYYISNRRKILGKIPFQKLINYFAE